MSEDQTERVADAATTRVLQRLTEKRMPDGRSAYAHLMDELTPAERAEVDRSVDRHAGRMRARGKPGW